MHRGGGIQCRIWVKPHPFLRAWQAPMFHMKRFWIYAASCSHFSSVNHLGAVRSCSPRPQANRWPAGEIEWKPAKPDTLKALSRIHAEMGRIEQQSNLECVYPRPENSCAANSVFAIICSLSKKKSLIHVWSRKSLTLGFIPSKLL